MKLLELELALNRWWLDSETERLLLGNDKELIFELTSRHLVLVGRVTHFELLRYVQDRHVFILTVHTTKGRIPPVSVQFLDLRLQSLQEGYRGI